MMETVLPYSWLGTSLLSDGDDSEETVDPNLGDEWLRNKRAQQPTFYSEMGSGMIAGGAYLA